MAGYNYARTQLTANRLITKYGRNAVLRRASGDRKIKCVMIDYSTREKISSGGLITFADQKALISALAMTEPPDMELDVIVLGKNVRFIAPFETWRLMAPPSKLDPAGTVIYWEAQVRK
jgi:hypothetical protein